MNRKGAKTSEPTLRHEFAARQIVVEIKAIERNMPVHEAQLLTCLKLSGHRLGLLINFNVAQIKDCLRRLVRS